MINDVEKLWIETSTSLGFQLSYELLNKSVISQYKAYSFIISTTQTIKLQELYDNSVVWKDSYYMPNNKETEGLIFNSEDKDKIFPKAFFPGNRIK